MRYEHKWGCGGVLSFRTDGQKYYTRLRSSTLGVRYDLEDIHAIIAGHAAISDGRKNTAQRFNLIVDIQKKIAEGKGPAYERWAKLYNLKQIAAAVQYLQEHKIYTRAELDEQANGTADRFHRASGKLKANEADIKRNKELKAAIVDYARTRPISDGYKAKKYSNQYLARMKQK